MATLSPDWDLRADVVVVGFGAAGACAAIEAAEHGADVVVLDRYLGGGATALSGGVVYAGGGTGPQRTAGVADTPEAMYAYLRTEVGDVVTDATLRDFCAGSADMVDWLESLRVPFEGSLCPYKTSYPTDRHYLYRSGSESSTGDNAARGHRVRGPGTSGRLLHDRLAAAVRAPIIRQTTAERLVTDATGRVVGVECHTLRGAPAVAHRVLHRLAMVPWLYAQKVGRLLHRPVTALERRYGRPLRIAADRGVVLATGGFVANREMLRTHAPAYRGGLPLGTPADDGSGIRLGESVGGTTAHLDRVSVWRFLSPPSALLRGVLVDRHGRRLVDESRYGAAVGEAVVTGADRTAWLLVDRSVLAEARRQVPGETLWFQRLQAWYLLYVARHTAATVPAVALKAGVDPEGLVATVKDYRGPGPDRTGKPAEYVDPLDTAPYTLIDCSIRPRPAYPAPMLTLGGLRVDERTGLVRRADGATIAGLYAAGRTAVGICSRSYVSGLSLADCVYSGRRAGRHAATHLT
jgi:3-oxo-5alpha-steroid 4-dehydrogenase